MAGDGETWNGRGWMYSGWIRGKPTDEWYENTKEFLDFAFSAQGNNVVQNGKIKCPCANCRNYVTKDRDCFELDLCGYGFKRNYSVWTEQLKQMMYQAHKEAVNMYCFIHDEPISDSEACKKKPSKPQYVEGRLEWCKDAEAWKSVCAYWCSDKFDTNSERGFLSRTSSLYDVAQNKGGSRNFNRTKEYIEKTFGPEQETSMNTYRFMKVGAKKYRESGSNTCIDNPRAKKRLDDYETGLKRAYPEDWQERDRDLDPAVTYSVSGGMPHGRLLIGDGSIRKSQVVVAARRSNIKPTNSMSYQDLLRRNQYLEKKNKNNSKHMKVLYINAGLPVPEDLEDDSMEDSDVNQSSPSIENGGTPLTTSPHEGEETDTPLSSQNHTTRTREDSPILDE